VDAEQRTAILAGIGAKVRADACERGLQIADQCQERLAHVPLVVGLVGGEPLAAVVSLECAQETEGGGGEV